MAGRACYIYAAIQNDEKKAALEASGATVICLPNAQGKVDLAAMLRDLAARGLNELHVEAGHKLNGSLLREGLVDEILIYMAPLLLGHGLGLAQMGPFEALSQGLKLDFMSVEQLGPDLRIVARVPGRDTF
jgi:diaminohydroxyphosphoribosylaminopyrimidine deaminase/5-amino-6-(5-phosphoribosylamino)uracil reductase